MIKSVYLLELKAEQYSKDKCFTNITNIKIYSKVHIIKLNFLQNEAEFKKEKQEYTKIHNVKVWHFEYMVWTLTGSSIKIQPTDNFRSK